MKQEVVLNEAMQAAVHKAAQELPSDVTSFYVQKTGLSMDEVIYEAMIEDRWKKGRKGAVYSNVLLLVVVGSILFGAVQNHSMEGGLEGEEAVESFMIIFIIGFFLCVTGISLALRWFRKPTKNFRKLTTHRLTVDDIQPAIDNLKSNVGKTD